jgi:hypothetical protein
MIVIVHFALLFALAAPLLRSGTRAAVSVATLLFALSPPLLAGLILLLDRPGLIKYWLVGLVATLFVPALVIWFDSVVVPVLFDSGTLPKMMSIGVLVLVNALGVLMLIRSAVRLPRRCPRCGLRSSLPLGRVSWCASCGTTRRKRS